MVATADFIADTTSGAAPLSVQFTDQSSGYAIPPDAWVWSKNNGSGWVEFDGAPNDQNPLETFTAGTWSIRLVASNEGESDEEIKTDYITVSGCAGADRVFSVGHGIIPVKLVDMGGIGRCLGKNHSFRLANDSSQYVQPLPMTCEDYLWATDQG